MATSEDNTLEQALRRAAAEPAERPAFYRLLLESTVYVIGTSDLPLGEGAALQSGARVQVQHWKKEDGSLVIPFFSSLRTLHQAVENEERYMALPGHILFEATRGSTLVLNPVSDCGKEFFPNEIEALLSGGLTRPIEQRVVKQETQVLLGQPREYPTALVESLGKLLAKHGNVRAAYLTLMHDPSADPQPHLVIGLDIEGDIDAAMRETGAVAADILPGEPVDLFHVVPGDGGLSKYFLESVPPFYKRA